MQTPAHLFAADDGALYDTRRPDWSSAQPLRPRYSMHVRRIETTTDLKACLRAGPYAFPGAYPLYFIMKDGEAVSFHAARESFTSLARNMSYWRDPALTPVGLEINYEDSTLYCAMSGEQIEPAYSTDEDEAP